ncbi:hypothetical protein D3C78_1116230 [compost metagenome]
MKRVAGASQPRSPNSARYTPARMPIGVPSRVPKKVIFSEPAMALIRPPSEPGGGVILVNTSRLMPARPLTSRVYRIHASQNRPNPIASSEAVMLKPLTKRRRA